MLLTDLKLSKPPAQLESEVSFTEDNKTVWKLSLEKKEAFINKYNNFIFKDYRDGFNALEFSRNKIPSLETLNERLQSTGWQVIYVDGYLHPNYYANFLSRKIAPISKHLRSLEHLNYAPGPDMLHDIFGHLPMLFSPDYCEYIISLGKIMAETTANDLENNLYHLHVKLSNLHSTLGKTHFQTQMVEKAIKNIEYELAKYPSLYTLLGRFFMWTIEFGILVTQSGKLQMYGAGLLSSESESVSFCEGRTKILPFTHSVAKTDYDFSSFQSQLFFSDSFSFLDKELKNMIESSEL